MKYGPYFESHCTPCIRTISSLWVTRKRVVGILHSFYVKCSPFVIVLVTPRATCSTIACFRAEFGINHLFSCNWFNALGQSCTPHCLHLA